MKPSDNCYAFIKKEEGCILHAYRDQAGIWTIGYGIIEYEDGTKVKSGDIINEQRAEALLKHQIDIKAMAVDAATHTVTLNQNQFDSLVSLAYNIGTTGFVNSTLLKKVKEGRDKTLAIDNMGDLLVRAWLESMNLRAVSEITYWFLVWCKITDPKTEKKVVSSDLIERRFREAKLYHS